MGISPEKKTELQKQFIARPDAAKSMIIYKWPEHHIRMVSIVTVQPDEVALFVKQGQLLGYLPGGEHQLDGPAIPFLQGKVDDVTGGKAMLGELYFVSTREFANKAFAGMMGQVNDPDTDVMVGLKVFGEYAMRVVDAGKLLLRLIGTQGMLNNTEIWDVTSDHLLQTLRAVSNQNVTEHKWHVLKLTSGAYNLDIEERVLGIVNERLDGLWSRGHASRGLRDHRECGRRAQDARHLRSSGQDKACRESRLHEDDRGGSHARRCRRARQGWR